MVKTYKEKFDRDPEFYMKGFEGRKPQKTETCFGETKQWQPDSSAKE